jgi:ABC-type antimicrobial peptide transport system permease subunit
MPVYRHPKTHSLSSSKTSRQHLEYLGSAISGIGLVVASITIFIVIFVNAITRRRYIGILKGIGINRKAILYSYIYQAVIYALSGIIVGMVLIFFFIKPYFTANPINFPFSDGILSSYTYQVHYTEQAYYWLPQ